MQQLQMHFVLLPFFSNTTIKVQAQHHRDIIKLD